MTEDKNYELNEELEEETEEVEEDSENGEKKFDVGALIAKGKSKGSLTSGEIVEALGEVDYDIDQIDKLYEDLENNGIEVNYLDSLVKRSLQAFQVYASVGKKIHALIIDTEIHQGSVASCASYSDDLVKSIIGLARYGKESVARS